MLTTPTQRAYFSKIYYHTKWQCPRWSGTCVMPSMSIILMV